MRKLRMVAIVLVVLSLTTFGWNFFPSVRQDRTKLQQAAAGLEKTVRYLSEEVGVRNYAQYDNLEKAARYVERRLIEAGLPVESWVYEANGQKFRNIVARYKNNGSDDYILVGAHYDSCFNPGADDNASGVAGVLQLAESLKKTTLKANIIFVAFTNEEPPFFKTMQMGSRVFVRAAKARGVTVKGAVVLEMIGLYRDRFFSQKYLPLIGPFSPNRGDFIAVVGNFRSKALVDVVSRAFREEKAIGAAAILAPSGVPGINFSDHASFWELGIPAVMITDTAYLRSEHYHQPTDTADTLDFVRMAAVIEGVKGAVIRLSER